MKSQKLQNKTFLDESLQACKIAVRYSFIFSFFSNLLMLIVPTYSMQVLDRVISSGSIETLTMLTVITFIAIVGYILISNIRSSMMMQLGHWLDKAVAPQIFGKLIESSAQGRRSEGTQAMSDFATIKNFIIGPTLSTLIDAPWAVIFMIVMFIIHPVIGFTTLLWGVVLFGLAIVNEVTTKPNIDAASTHAIRASRHVEASTRNAEVVEAMGMVGNVQRMWDEQNFKSSLLQLTSGGKAGVVGSVAKFVRMLAQVSITGFGAYFVLKHEMSTGGMIGAGILASKALAPFDNAISSWKGVIQARKSLERLHKIIGNAPERIENIELPEPKGRVSFDKVYFVPYGGNKPILNGVSFAIEAGDILGVIGPSASGKSSTAKLLTGVWKPNSGTVRLDGADVYHWRRGSFGKYVGYLPQDIELFAGSVKENISRMDKNANEEAIVKAAQNANAHEMILALPLGYRTEIGDGGTNLSSGQRQRIGLARAFFGNPKLIVLDEPNSNLDTEGEIALAGALKNAKINGSTVVLISHKPDIISLTDKILIMKNGIVAEFGLRDEVLAKLYNNAPVKQNNYKTPLLPQSNQKMPEVAMK